MKLEQAARQALEALEVSTDWDVGAKGKQLQSMKAIIALREALTEQAEQEQVCIDWDTKTDEPIMGYAAPVRTKDLTDDEIWEIEEKLNRHLREFPIKLARAVIAADREKNRGAA